MLEYATLSKAGKRNYNEDYLTVSSASDKRCFVVCDGLGGHGCGDVAAKMAADILTFRLDICKDCAEHLEKSFFEAQKQIKQYQKDEPTKKDMKTTAVCMIADETNVFVGSVGDSRFYGFYKDSSFIRTKDHSIPQILVQSGTISEEEIRNHPSRNMLLKALGDDTEEPLCEMLPPMPLDHFSAFLLCSDGFWEYILEEEMISLLSSSRSAKKWLNKMAALVEERGMKKDMDNFSAIAIMSKKEKFSFFRRRG